MRDQTSLWQALAQPKVAYRKELRKAAETMKQKESGWADPWEFRNALTRVDMDAKHVDSAGGVPLASDGHTAYVDSSDKHTLIIGSTGSMKSRLLCMPTLEVLARCGESVVVADPKGELYLRTSEAFRSRGYNVQVVNLRDPMCGSRWNPLSVPYRLYNGTHDDQELSREMVMDLCMNIMPTLDKNDPFWDMSARELFRSMVMRTMNMAESEEEVTLKELFKRKTVIFSSEYTRNAFKNNNGSVQDYQGIISVINNADTTRRCILGCFDMHLLNYLSKSSLEDMMAGNDIDFTKVGRQKTALFLLVPDEKDTYNGLVSLFVKQLYESLIREAQTCKNGSLPVRVNFILDEFASFPVIPNMQSMITASRSRNIRFMLVVQSVKQLYSLYGNDAYAIKSNCLNWIFLSGRDIEFLQELCSLMGEDAEGKPLMTLSQLQRLDKGKGEALVLNDRQAPYLTNLADIDMYPKCKRGKLPRPRNADDAEDSSSSEATE